MAVLVLTCSSDQQRFPLLRTAVGAAEDPEKILDQAVNEMQSDLIKMRQAAAQVQDAEGVTAEQGMQQPPSRVFPAAKQSTQLLLLRLCSTACGERSAFAENMHNCST